MRHFKTDHLLLPLTIETFWDLPLVNDIFKNNLIDPLLLGHVIAFLVLPLFIETFCDFPLLMRHFRTENMLLPLTIGTF